MNRRWLPFATMAFLGLALGFGTGLALGLASLPPPQGVTHHNFRLLHEGLSVWDVDLLLGPGNAHPSKTHWPKDANYTRESLDKLGFVPDVAFWSETTYLQTNPHNHATNWITVYFGDFGANTINRSVIGQPQWHGQPDPSLFTQVMQHLKKALP
jgi:hypothetical protein